MLFRSTNWQELQKEQEAAAGSVADLKTDFSSTMDELQQELAADIEAMDLGDEAAEAGKATIQGYIDGAVKMTDQVETAYANLARAATNALGNRYSGTYAAQFDPAVGARGYASGTSSAPPGWAWVGEEGPELIRMRGGETVLPADISEQFAYLTANYNNVAAYAGGTDDVPELLAVSNEAYNNVASYSDGADNVSELLKASNAAYATYNETVSNHGDNVSNTVSYGGSSTETIAAVEAVPSGGYSGDTAAPVKVEVHIHIEGNATPETVQTLEDYVRRGELQEAVADAMENIQTDARRVAYV